MSEAHPGMAPNAKAPFGFDSIASRTIVRWIWCGWIVATGVSAAEMQTPAGNLPPPGLEIQTRADPKNVTVGDPINIDFDITLPKGFKAQAPQMPGQVGDFAVLQYFPGPVVPGTETKRAAKPSGAGKEESSHYRARVVVALYKPGDYSFPAVSFELQDPSGRTAVLSSEPVVVRIQNTLADKDLALRDLKRQADIAEPVRWALWLAIGLALLIAACLLWWLWKRRRTRLVPAAPAQPRLDPLQLAESELRDLLVRGLLEKGLIKQFYVLLSEITKKSLEAGYGIQTFEKTSAEIMDELSTGGIRTIPADETEGIRSLLVACDLVKFAKHLPSRSESDASVKLAFEVLDACKRRGASPAMPAPTAGVA
jgi:hypothetical protein